MPDDVVEPNEPVEQTAAPDAGTADVEPSRKDRNAARRAEFEAVKAAKAASKAASKEAHAAERAAAKEAKQELIAQAKAAKAAKKEAKAAAKSGRTEQDGTVEEEQDSDRRTRGEKKPRKEKAKKEKAKKEKPAKPEKDPYRPRFATAPTKVRAFTMLASALAVVHTVVAFLLVLEASSSPILGVLPEDAPQALAYVGASVALLVAALWATAATMLCAGRLLGKRLGIAAFVLGLPLSLVVAPLLFSSDVRDWAL